MRLIDTTTLELVEFNEAELPPYAILSHTWETSEVLYHDLVHEYPSPQVTTRPSFKKVRETCRVAREVHKYQHCWIDTCCIDKSSSAELSEAINSMFRWYKGAGVCLVYLADLRSSHSDDLAPCRWFTRGWTLQELIAPEEVLFYNFDWEYVGSKKDLVNGLSRITGISKQALLDAELLPRFPVAARMSWASSRQTTRVEDRAYCLMGLFDVNMPMLYGEGEKAFLRLQQEIIGTSNDMSLFAWKSSKKDEVVSGILAPSPDAFVSYKNFELSTELTTKFNGEFSITNNGLRLTTRLFYSRLGIGGFLLPLGAALSRGGFGGQSIGIYLKKYGPDLFVRSQPGSVIEFSFSDKVRPAVDERTIYVRLHMTTSLLAEISRSRKFAFRFSLGQDLEPERGYPQSLWNAPNNLVLTFGVQSRCWGALLFSFNGWGRHARGTNVEVVAFGIRRTSWIDYENITTTECYLVERNAFERVPEKLLSDPAASEEIFLILQPKHSQMTVKLGTTKFELSAALKEDKLAVNSSKDEVLFHITISTAIVRGDRRSRLLDMISD